MTGVWASSTVAGVPSMWAPVIVFALWHGRYIDWIGPAAGVISAGSCHPNVWNGSAVSQRELANSAVRAKRSTFWARAQRAHPMYPRQEAWGGIDSWMRSSCVVSPLSLPFLLRLCSLRSRPDARLRLTPRADGRGTEQSRADFRQEAACAYSSSASLSSSYFLACVASHCWWLM